MNTQSIRGNQRPRVGTLPSRQWHGSPSDIKAIKYSQTRSAKLVGWSAIAVTLLCGLIYLLPYSPDKTPCFVLIESNYEAPYPVNPFAQEDISLLQELDGETLSVYAASPSWRSVASGLGEFSRQLNLRSDEVGRRGCCIVYINALGMVNDLGEPCIVPATANPHDTTTWVPLQRLLDALTENLPKNAKKLVILDCARIQVDWDLGLFYNAFVERTSRLLEQNNPNTLVLTSSAPGEIAWPRSSFALNLVQGLAGLASGGRSTEATISARELHDFVSTRVQSWALRNRGKAQTPQLFIGAGGDVDLATTIHPSVVRRLADYKLSALENESSIATNEVSELWKMLSVLKSTPVVRMDPIRFRNLQHRLLRLEQLNSAGRATAPAASEALDSLKTELETLSQGDWAGLSQQWKTIGWVQPHFLPLLRPHSIDLAQAMGSITSSEAQSLRASVHEAIREYRGNSSKLQSLRNELTGFSELQFLQISEAADTFNQWPKNSPLSSIAELRELGARHAAGIAGSTFEDPRVHARLRPYLTEAFESIRASEDALWGTDDIKALESHSNRARNLLSGILEKHSALTKAFEIADQANNELPYWGQWLGDAWNQEHPDTAAADLLPAKQLLLELSGSILQLNRQLTVLRIEEESQKAIVDMGQAVLAAHRALQKIITLHADALIAQSDATPATWRQMHALLATPLVFGERRQKLSKRHDETRRQLLNAYEEASEVAALEESKTNDQRQEYIMSLLAWAPQVACSIAAPDQDRLNVSVLASVGKPEEIAETVNQRMRRHLTECASLSNIATGSGATSTEPNSVTLPYQERIIRSAAGLWFSTNEMHILQYQHLTGVQEYFLWLAMEALRDSWGGRMGNDMNQPSNDPFFAIVAGDYLNAAESITLPQPIFDDEIDNIRQRLAKQRLTAVGGISATAKDGSSAPGLGYIQIDATLAPVVPDIELVPGVASIFVRSPRGQRTNVKPADAAINPNSPALTPQIRFPLDERFEPTFSVVIDRSAEITGKVNLITFFRGLEVVAPFSINNGQGARYSFEPREYGNARVTLIGEGKQQSSILFVLDCSSSMADPVPSERPGIDNQSKLDIAKGYLAGMLDELARDGRARVGLIAFGHRMGWSKTAPVKLLTQPRYAFPIPESVTPSNDIETLLSLGRFDSTEAAKLGDRLNDLVPWGQSPVHSSILDAIELFSLESDETDKSIIVITDGVNYQFTPPDRMTINNSPASLASVVERLKEKPVPVHVLGFGVEQDERMETQLTFEQIAKSSGGSYRLASSGRELLDLLNSQLGAGSYELRVGSEASTKDSDSINYRLNETVQVLTRRGPPITAKIAHRDAVETLELYDGQWLQLAATQLPQIRSVPYETGSPVSIPLVAENSRETGHVLRVQRPINRDNHLDLTVSLQAQYKVFTTRPAEVLLEVTPVSENAKTYYFYDAHYQPYEPVPVLSWTAENWPRESRSARVRFWCKSEITRPVKSILVSDLLQSDAKFFLDEPIPGANGVTCRVEIDKNIGSPTQVILRVLEVHDVSSKEMSPVRVDLTNAGNILTKVERYIDSVNGVGQHVFHLDLTSQVNPTDLRALLNFTLTEAAKSQAWRLQDESIDVEISDLNAVLPIAKQ